MLPKNLRIGSRLRVTHVFKKGRRVGSPYFQWRILPTRAAKTRFSLMVTKKVGKRAVDRNRARRRVYEAIAKNLPELPKTCYDVVVLLNPSVLEAPFQSLVMEVKRLMKRL